MNGSVVTVEMAGADSDPEGIEEIIAGLYLYWVDGVEVPDDDELTDVVG
jgi:hypothetical protein